MPSGVVFSFPLFSFRQIASKLCMYAGHCDEGSHGDEATAPPQCFTPPCCIPVGGCPLDGHALCGRRFSNPHPQQTIPRGELPIRADWCIQPHCVCKLSVLHALSCPRGLTLFGHSTSAIVSAQQAVPLGLVPTVGVAAVCHSLHGISWGYAHVRAVLHKCQQVSLAYIAVAALLPLFTCQTQGSGAIRLSELCMADMSSLVCGKPLLSSACLLCRLVCIHTTSVAIAAVTACVHGNHAWVATGMQGRLEPMLTILTVLEFKPKYRCWVQRRGSSAAEQFVFHSLDALSLAIYYNNLTVRKGISQRLHTTVVQGFLLHIPLLILNTLPIATPNTILIQGRCWACWQPLSTS